MIPAAELDHLRGRLRKPTVNDRKLLFAWRNADNVRRFMLNDSAITWEEHCTWFETIQDDQTILFFVFEFDTDPAGAVYFTDVNRTAGITHWGFYIDPSRPNLGIGTAMAYLALSCAFDELGFRKIIADVMNCNERSIKFHRSLGFRLTSAYRDNRTEDRGGVLVFELLAAEWQSCRNEVIRRLIDRRPDFAWLT